MDFLSLSRGGKFEDAQQPKIGEAVYPYTGPSGYECMPTVDLRPAGAVRPECSEPPWAASVRSPSEAGFETPVVVAGGICTFEQAEGILQDGARPT